MAFKHRLINWVAGGVIGAVSVSALAMPQSEYLRKVEETRQNTRDGKSTWQGEAFDLLALLTEYATQRVASWFSVVETSAPKGQDWNYAFYHADRTTETVLSYGWFDSRTLHATASPLSSVAGVRYEVNKFPESNVFELLGYSFNAQSDFALNYTIGANSTFEPIFRATALDANGMPIALFDADGSNLAVGYGMILDVPEPATLLLSVAGLVAVAMHRRRLKPGLSPSGLPPTRCS